jgi:chromate transport protein ChrA
VFAVFIEAVLRVGRRALKSKLAVGIAAMGFGALFFFAVPFLLVVAVPAIFAANRLGVPWAVTPPTARTMLSWVSTFRSCPAVEAGQGFLV